MIRRIEEAEREVTIENASALHRNQFFYLRQREHAAYH